jgi:hypothetical protein
MVSVAALVARYEMVTLSPGAICVSSTDKITFAGGSTEMSRLFSPQPSVPRSQGSVSGLAMRT